MHVFSSIVIFYFIVFLLTSCFSELYNCLFHFATKMNREGKSTIDVPEEYVGLVLGNKDRNKERIETKSETKINVSFRKKAKGRLKSYYSDKINKLCLCVTLKCC